MVLKWLKLALSWFRDGCIGALVCLLDRILAPSRLEVSRIWVYDGYNVGYGGRKWFKLDRRRIRDDEDGLKIVLDSSNMFLTLALSFCIPSCFCHL